MSAARDPDDPSAEGAVEEARVVLREQRVVPAVDHPDPFVAGEELFTVFIKESHSVWIK